AGSSLCHAPRRRRRRSPRRRRIHPEGAGQVEESPGRIYRQNRRLTANKNPPDACLGRARVSIRWATVSPYSPCCFQEYVGKLNTEIRRSSVYFCKPL